MDFFRKIAHYLSYDIWFQQEHEYTSPRMRWLVRQLKVLIVTGRGIGRHDLMLRSAALTFFTLMSIVPFAALVFGIAKGFGIEERFTTYLHIEFSQYTIVIDQVVDFAHALLKRTNGGIIATIGLLMLFWSLIKVFSNLEDSFNKIWEVRKSRSVTRKFSDYLSVIIVAPLLWVLSSTLRFQLRDQLLHVADSWSVNFAFGVVSLVVMWVIFTFLYRVMPNTKVKIKHALWAGMIAGTVFLLFQIIYMNIQSSLTNYNAIYGSFAAVPLLLIWIQTSWQIMLLGGELSFAFQNIGKFEHEKRAGEMSYDYRKKAMLVVMQQIVKHFLQEEKGVSSEQIAEQAGLSVRIVRDVIFELEHSGLLVSTVGKDEKVNFYLPAKDVHALHIYDIVHRVETNGSDPLEVKQSPEFHAIDALLERMGETVKRSPDNMLIMDICHTKKQASRKKSEKT